MKHDVHVHNEGDVGLAAGGDSTLVANVRTHSTACPYAVDEMTGELYSHGVFCMCTSSSVIHSDCVCDDA